MRRAPREYHEAVGPDIFRFEGTLERFTGDGLMVSFNDWAEFADAGGLLSEGCRAG